MQIHTKNHHENIIESHTKQQNVFMRNTYFCKNNGQPITTTNSREKKVIL